MYQSIGSALLIGGQDSEAAKAFELAVRFAPDSSPDEADLGSAYAALGSSQLAEAHLERALEIDPLNLNAAELLIDLYVKDGQSSRAEVVRRRFTSLIH
jgi:tetratricopeptide (TPR) repeat protein